MSSTRFAPLGLALLVAACGGESFSPSESPPPPLDVAGSYTITVVNHENGCSFDNWMEGQTSMAIPLTLTQDGREVIGTFDGVTGAIFALWVGSNTLLGEVDGTKIALAVHGTNKLEASTCAYTVTAEASADLTGDAIQGEMTYRAVTDKSAACVALEGCVTKQAFIGTRPPH